MFSLLASDGLKYLSRGSCFDRLISKGEQDVTELDLGVQGKFISLIV